MSDVAHTVAPNCDKLDLQRFYTDLSRYFPFLSEKACSDWEDFKANNLEKLKVQTISWNLPGLMSAAIRSTTLCHTNPENSVNQDTLRLLEKEVAIPKPVSACNCVVIHVLY